ncbi:SRPBCC family protein [Paraburkholderia sp. RL18-085-BIA-A]|uniref:hypothetical protein n=1 Tax=Paraburkholderia sp. RL18-085-BIA-A TaxID=3031633 RepID=UPI0038BC2D36
MSDAKQFGRWLGIEFDSAFVADSRLTGRITPTTVDAEGADSQEPYSGKAFELDVERIKPMRLFPSGGIHSPSIRTSTI